MKTIFHYLILIAVLYIPSCGVAGRNDLFEKIKNEFASAPMITLEVEIISHSKIFESADSSTGMISIANDGRYCARLDEDVYLFDGKCIWEVSAENRQATKQCLKEGEKFENRLFFLKDLDNYYNAKAVKGDAQYLLILKKKRTSSLPDSLNVYLDSQYGAISKIDYHDLNGDLNEVIIKKQTILNGIDSSIFHIQLPDSTEVINLP